MKKNLLLGLVLTTSLILSAQEMTKNSSAMTKAGEWMKKVEVFFTENKGQVYNLSDNTPNTSVRFLLEQPGMKLFLMEKGMAIQFEKWHYPEGYLDLMAEVGRSEENEEKLRRLQKEVRLETWRVDMSLLGANPNALFATEGKSADYVNYYNRNTLDVHSYEKVVYHDIYPNIDWVFYSTEEGLKYDFVVHPGGDPSNIKMMYSDQESLALDEGGNLQLGTSLGTYSELAPVSFQGGVSVATSFVKEGNICSFNLDEYDRSKTLVIDPLVRLWGTYYSQGGDYGRSCATDAIGNVYLTGYTGSVTGIASNGYQMTYGGSSDAFLVKLDTNGNRIWGTYFGGANADYGRSCATDASGNVVMVGETGSTAGVAYNGHQLTYGGGTNDAFVAKFNENGQLIWSSYYGGVVDDEGWGCSIDGLGNVFLAGQTLSTTNIAYNGHQITSGTGMDAFLVKFDANGIRLWGTFYGGWGQDYGHSCAVDQSGNIYLGGRTTSQQAIGFNGFQNTMIGSENAFLVKFNSSGIRQWGTYYGSNTATNPDGSIASGKTRGFGITSDLTGAIYLCGYTNCTAGIASSGYQIMKGGGDDAFLVKFSASGSRQWATYYGGSGLDDARVCATDQNNNVMIVGRTWSTSSISNSGFQNTLGGAGPDAYLAKFNSSGLLSFGTYYGGVGSEEGWCLSTDNVGNIYLGGWTNSSSGIAANGFENTFYGSINAFLVKFRECTNTTNTINQTSCGSFTLNSTTYTTSGTYTQTLTNVAGCDSTITLNLTVNPLPNVSAGNDQTICSGTPVTLSGSGANIYTWNNGVQNGIPFVPTASNSYILTGTNTSTGCSNSDVAIVTVNPLPNASITPAGATTFCQGASVVLNANTGTGLTYQWKNNGTNISGATAASYTATAAGSYTVVVTNSNNCSATSAAVGVTVNPLPTVNAGNEQTICSGTPVTLAGSGANTYTWNNGVQNGIPFVPAGSNSYIVTGTNTSTGCSNSDVAVVTVNPLPAATITPAGATTFCEGASVVLNANTGTGLTYQWKNNGTNISGATAASYTATASGSYTVFVTNSNNCSETSAAVGVTVNPLPIVNAGNDQTICSGTPVTLAGNGANTYTWNNGVQNGIPFVPAGSNSYIVTGTNTSTGCSNSDVAVVTVNPLPAATITPAGATTFCEGASVVLNANTGTGLTYQWKNNGTNISGATAASYTATAAGSYTVVVTNSNNCSETSAAVGVTVNPLPIVNAGNDQTICSGTPVTLAGNGANTYTWNNGVQNGIPFVPTASNSYILTGTNTSTGCSNSDVAIVTVNPLPNVFAGQDFAVCSGDQITLSGSGASSYTWDNGVSNGVPFTEQGTQTYTVTGTDGNNCSNTGQVTVTVNPLPTINGGADQVVCEGDPVTLSATGGSTYTWNNGVNNGSAFTPTHLGDLTYTVIGTDVSNCSNTDEVVVTVNEHSAASQTATGLDSYTWPVNGQAYIQSGTYTAVIPNEAGCDSTITLNLTMNFTGIAENGTTNFTIYPNPANDVLYVVMPAESNESYTLYDSRGRKVLEGKLTGTETQIDLKEVSHGAYMLKIGEGKVPVRVIKQ